MKVINLLSGPRNISTALMYSFAQRDDTRVFDEPFYGYYLDSAKDRMDHPSQQEIVESMECDAEKIIDAINHTARNSTVFVKGMAHHMIMEDLDFMLNWQNVILIRHPEKLIASFSKVIPDPTINDIGILKAAELFHYLRNRGKDVVVIDSDELMLHPGNYLKKLCGMLGLEFQESMLTWKPGGIPEDGIWAKHWYSTVHTTEGFQVQPNKSASIPSRLGSVLEEALPHYEKLKTQLLKND